MAGSQAEEGCLIYRFTADLDDPRLFHLVELWESEAAFAGHATGAPFRNFLAELHLVGRVVRSVARQGPLEHFDFTRPGRAQGLTLQIGRASGRGRGGNTGVIWGVSGDIQPKRQKVE